MNEFAQFISAKLKADSTLTGLLGGQFVFVDLPPQGQQPPYILIGLQAGGDEAALGTFLSFTKVTYQVKGVTFGEDTTPGSAIASQIKAILQGTGGLVGTTFKVKTCFRVRPLEYADLFQGVRYNYIGGLYRLMGSAVTP